MIARHWLVLGGMTFAALAIGLVVRTFLPQRLATEIALEQDEDAFPNRSLPHVDVTFLRCGSNVVPVLLAVRGSFSLASRSLAYSAVLVRHPRGTFLYDTGLCADIQQFLQEQPFWFRAVFRSLVLESPISLLLQHQDMKPQDLDFILLSHLHWDHVSGIPDLPGVPLRIHRVEYESAPRRLPAQHYGLVKSLLCNNPIELFDLLGPAFAGFQASHDLFGDGSIILVPLPGHTDGQVGMFILHANEGYLFLIADAAWLSENYQMPAPMHPLVWSILSSDNVIAIKTLIKLHHFARRYPEIPMIAMHDASMQEAFGGHLK
jgi:N-acyl homoserine lactone hydrolase